MPENCRYNNTRFFIIESAVLKDLRCNPGACLLMWGAVLVLFVLPAIMEQRRRIDPFPVDLKPFLQRYDRPDLHPENVPYYDGRSVCLLLPHCFVLNDIKINRDLISYQFYP